MFLNFKSGIQVLGLFKDKIYVTNTYNFTNTEPRDLAKFLIFCRYNKVKFANENILLKLNIDSIQEIKRLVARMYGFTMFDIEKEYGVTELLKTLAQYLTDYGNFDFDKSIWIQLDDKIKDFKGKERIIKLDDNIENLYDDLREIVSSPKNPSAYENGLLGIFEKTTTGDIGRVANKIVLGTILKANPNIKFNAANPAQVRIYAQVVKSQKFKTSQKTFIMRELSKFPLGDILDEFAANTGFWKYIESAIIPTQNRYKNYDAATAFGLLRDNNFHLSNNSQVETALKSEASGSDIFKKLCELKSPQFAIRNLSRIKNIDADMEDTILESDIRLKQLIEAQIGLSNVAPEKTAKIRGKFWTRSCESKNTDEYTKMLNRAIIKQAKVKLAEYADLIRDTNSPEHKRYIEAPDCTIETRLLSEYALPLNTENFMSCEDLPLATRGSEIQMELLKGKYCVFVSWKRKDSKEGDQDIDLSCNAIPSGYKFELLNAPKDYACVNYASLLKGGIKHSGDFTSCIEFNPDTGYITTEMISVDPSIESRDLHFMINTFNGVNMKEYDVYVGIAPFKAYKKCVRKDGNCTFSLDAAYLTFKIEGDICGYYKLFTISGNKILLEGTPMNDDCGVASHSAIRNSTQSAVYTANLRNFSAKDFVELLSPLKQEVNPHKLKLLLDYAINS